MNEDSEIQASLEPVVLYKLNAEQGEGVDLSKEYSIKGYPTFVMMNGDGVTLDRWIGYSKDYFISTIGDAVIDPVPIETRLASYSSKPGLNDALVLGRYSASLDKYKDAVDYYTMAQKLNNDPAKNFSYDIFINTVDGARGDDFTFDDAAKAADAVLASPDADRDEIYGVARSMAGLAQKKKTMDKAAPFLEAGIKALVGSEDPADLARYNYLMTDYSLYISKDLDQAVVYKKASMPAGWAENAGDLNSFAWWCFENNVDLKDAEDLSRKSVELADTGREKAMYLDTLAEICNSLGKYQEAVDLTKSAIAENPDSDYYKKQLDRFEKIVALHN